MDGKTEIPPELAVRIAAGGPVRKEYETWRVVAYNSDGSWYFVPNNRGYDYKLRRNAEKEAERCIACRLASYAVAKRIKVVEAEVLDGAV